MKTINEVDLKQVIEDLTGERFNRENKIHSPFRDERTPSFGIKFDSNKNKWHWQDFGTDEGGDAIDFVMKYRNYSYVEARRYLQLEVEKSVTEDYEEIINKFIHNQVSKGKKKGYKPLGIFVFVNKDNKPIYAKAKFLKPNGKKETPYYHLENGQVICNRGHEEVPYNYYELLKGIAENKTIIFVEGEKDVNTVQRILNKKDYVVTSIKGFDDFDKLQSELMKVYVIGDTENEKCDGSATRYVDKIKYNFIKYCKSFKIINLPDIKKLGFNKDITDWIEAGHTKQELLKAFDRSLDLKNKNELQQDNRGIYYLKFKKKDDEYIKEYITDFNLLEASKVNKIDAEIQGIRIKIKSCIDGKIVEKIGSSKIFDDVRAFRNFLGMDYSFMGSNVQDLVRLKTWINWYWGVDNKEIYQGAKFLKVENKEEFKLVTATGTLKADSTDYSIIADQTKIDMMDIPEVTTEELQELMQNLFRFCEYSKAISIIGSVISFLEVGQNIAANEKLHHLLIVGESGSGKSTILERVVAPLLNYPVEEKKAISTTTFATQKILSTGNYPVLFDEFKPSMMDQRKIQKLSDMLRNAYDRTTINRGDKSFEIKDFKLTRPIVIAGEESYPNSEKALVTRSCIVYISKHERSEENTESMVWLMEHEELLKKLGKSLILQALKLPVEEYKSLRYELRQVFKNLKDRPQNTAINIATGIELLNKVLIKADLKPIGNYYSSIEANIRDEVLDNGEDAYSEVEKMLIMYNNMIQNNNHFVDNEAVQFSKGGNDFGKLYIRTQLMIDAIFKYCNEVKEIDTKTLLTSRDFKKQAKKSGYIKGVNTKQLRIGAYQNYAGRNAWFDEYDKDLLKKLRIDSIVDCDGWEDAVSFAEGQF